MIYSDEFVWLHFPKCAGTRIAQIFKDYFLHDDRIIQDTISPEAYKTLSWHDSIADREARNLGFHREGKVVICSFRRLPSWLISRYSFESRRSPHLKHQPELLLEGKFLEQDGRMSCADYYVRKYLPPNILDSCDIRFIRTEVFTTDFLRVFGEFIDTSVIPRWEFEQKSNTSTSVVPNLIKRKLLEGTDVYQSCPYWATVEELAYG